MGCKYMEKECNATDFNGNELIVSILDNHSVEEIEMENKKTGEKSFCTFSSHDDFRKFCDAVVALKERFINL